MKNKRLIMILVVLMAIIGLYLYFAVNKATAAVPVSPVKLGDPDDGEYSEKIQPTIENPVFSDDAGIVPPVIAYTTKGTSWLDWLKGSGPMPGETSYTTLYNPSKFPLKNGSSGGEVLNLQKYLNTNDVIPFSKLKEDGIFGNLTQAALLRTTGSMEISEAWYKQNILKA
jgi:hypothetical protein